MALSIHSRVVESFLRVILFQSLVFQTGCSYSYGEAI